MLHSSSSGSSKNSTVVRSKTALRATRAALQTAYLVSEDLGTQLAERLFTTPHRYPRPERERAILASGWRRDLDVVMRSPRWHGAHRQVATWRWGTGPTVLLVHGWEGRGAQLGAFVEPLVRAGLSVVAFDAPGHGDSPGSRLYLTDLADCVAAVAGAITAEGPLHAIVAHSFGAAAVLLAAERSGVRAARNVMIAPNVLLDRAIAKFAEVVALDPGDRASLEDGIRASAGVAPTDLGLDRLVGERDAALLVIHDRDDVEVPFVHGERLAETWRQAQLIETHGLGHRRVLRDDAVIAEVVGFASHGIAPPTSPLIREVDRLLADA